jgi:transposase
MSKSYKPYDLDQAFLLPPSLREWLLANHLVYFVADVVNTLDLSKIEDAYGSNERGQPPYHPAMMVALLFYAYCIGIPSSRKIEKKHMKILPSGSSPQDITRITTQSLRSGTPTFLP